MPVDGASVTVVCGGTAVGVFSTALMARFGRIDALVNAYDDGLSSGKIRRQFQMLGPSDVMKVILAFAVGGRPQHRRLVRLLRSRLPDSEPAIDCANAGGREQEWDLPGLLRRHLGGPQSDQVLSEQPWLERLFERVQGELGRRPAVEGREFLAGMVVRNLAFLGAFLENDRSYSAAIRLLTEKLNSRVNVVLSDESNIFLRGELEGGAQLETEAELARNDLRVPLRALRFVDRYRGTTAAQPVLTRQARSSVQACDLIAYMPGSFASSLLPTLATPGLAQVIRGRNVPKVWIPSLLPGSATTGIRCALEILGRIVGGSSSGDHRHGLRKLVSHIVADAHSCEPEDRRWLETICATEGMRLLWDEFASPRAPGRHDAERVAVALCSIREGRL